MCPGGSKTQMKSLRPTDHIRILCTVKVIFYEKNHFYWSFLLDTKSHSVAMEGSRVMWRRRTNTSVIHLWWTCYWRDIKPPYRTMNPNCTVLQLLGLDLFLDSTFCLFLIFGVTFHRRDMNTWPNANPAFKGTEMPWRMLGFAGDQTNKAANWCSLAVHKSRMAASLVRKWFHIHVYIAGFQIQCEW